MVIGMRRRIKKRGGEGGCRLADLDDGNDQEEEEKAKRMTIE